MPFAMRKALPIALAAMAATAVPAAVQGTETPSWWQRFLPPPGTPTVGRPAAPVPNLARQDLAMAQELINARTMTLPSAVPGARTRVGPGPLSGADRLVLFSLKSSYLSGFRVPGTWFLDLLGAASDTPTHKRAAELFWDEYSSTTVTEPKGGLQRALQTDFGWYLDVKMVERLKASNRRLEQWQKGQQAWANAVEAERALTEKWRAREEGGRLARDAYLKGWAADDAERYADQLEQQQGANPATTEARNKALLARQQAAEAQAKMQQHGATQ